MKNTQTTFPQLRKGPAQVTDVLTPGSAILSVGISAAKALVGCCLS